MKETLRKVQFNLSDEKSYSYGDLESDDEGILKERFGVLHCWGESVSIDSETNQKFQETVAIVEEINSGKVYKVDPNSIVFVKK